MKDARVTTVVNALILLVIWGWASAASIASDSPDGPVIQIEDVTAFYKLYTATDGHPTAEQLQHDYLDQGSAGLHRMARLRDVTGARIAEAMAKYPGMYANAQRCMATAATIPLDPADGHLLFPRVHPLIPVMKPCAFCLALVASCLLASSAFAQNLLWLTPHPPYPAAAVAAHAAGKVTFVTKTNSHGKIVSVSITKSAGTTILDRFTEVYVRDQWSGPPNARHTWTLEYRLK